MDAGDFVKKLFIVGVVVVIVVALVVVAAMVGGYIFTIP